MCIAYTQLFKYLFKRTGIFRTLKSGASQIAMWSRQIFRTQKTQTDSIEQNDVSCGPHTLYRTQETQTLNREIYDVGIQTLLPLETRQVGADYLSLLDEREKKKEVYDVGIQTLVPLESRQVGAVLQVMKNIRASAEAIQYWIGAIDENKVLNHQILKEITRALELHSDVGNTNDAIVLSQPEVDRILQNIKDYLSLMDERVNKKPIDAKSAERWRMFESGGSWTKEYQDHLVEEIKENKMPVELQVKDARILVLGSINTGKSSFINSVASIDIGRLATPMLVGNTAKFITRQLKEYKPVNILKSFRILDTMGIEDREGEGFNVQDLVYLVQGNVMPHYKFNPVSSISESDLEYFKKNPALEDQVHCSVLVVDSNVVYSETIADEAKQKIKELQNRVIDNNIPTVLLLTKIDELCDEVANDISATFHSRKVYDAVVKAKDNFGVPEMNIFPVKCYSNETELKTNVNILILLALRKMVQMANDRLMMIPK